MIDVTELRRSLNDPAALCEALGLSRGAKRQARGVTVLCPFHKEKTPSLSVTLGDDGTLRFRCFGCGESGDALSLVAAVRGLDIKSDFLRVAEEAASLAGVHVDHRESERKRGPVRLDAASYAALTAHLVEICPWPDDPDVYSYMERRVLVIQGSAAGLAGLPRAEAQAPVLSKLLETFSVETLVGAGLVWEDRGTKTPDLRRFARPDHRLLIPWRGLDGSIAILQRRRLDAGEPKYIFPPGMKPALPFGAERLRAHEADRAIVFCEGAADVLALRLLDSRDGLGILPLGLPGLDGWRPDWARFAKGREARIGFDADEAGEKKVEAVAADLYRAGATRVQRWTPKGAKDWAELVEHGAPMPGEERAS